MTKQHVITEWLLKEFAAATPGGLVLRVLDKKSGIVTDVSPSKFLVEVDAHSDEIEKELSKHESRAKQSLMNLGTQMEKPPPGVYMLMRSDKHGEEFSFEKQPPARYVDQMALLPSGVLNVSDDRTIVNIARYVAITYTRSPRMRRYRMRLHEAIETSVRRELRRKGVPVPDDLESMLGTADLELSPVRMVERLEGSLAAMTWWAIRTEPDDPMILSDCPVASTVALGHAAERIHLLQDNALAVVMPLARNIAVVATPKALLPLSGPERTYGQMVNATIWPWALQYLLSDSEETLRSIEVGLVGPRSIVDEPPHAAAAKIGRTFTRAELIPSIKVKEGRATGRERHIVERIIGRRLPPNEVMVAAHRARKGRSDLVD